MIESKKDFFKRIALKQELKNNRLSIVLANHPESDIANREEFFDRLFPLWQRYNEDDRSKITLETKEEESNDLSAWKKKDLRIKKILLSNIRGIEQSEIPYGIDFCDEKGKPQSIVILGANGVGKSTVFDAIEMTYCNEVSEAEYRGYNKERLKHYLERFDRPFHNVICKVETQYGILDILQKEEDIIPKELMPSTHFISQGSTYKVLRLEFTDINRGQSKFKNILAANLGLAELQTVVAQLNAFAGYSRRKETTQRNNLSASIATNSNFKEEGIKQIYFKKNQIEELRKGITTSSNNELNSRISVIQNTISQLQTTSLTIRFDYEVLWKNIDNFKEAFENFNAINANDGGLKLIQFLTDGKELLEHSTNCPFCESSTLSKEELNNAASKRLEALEEKTALTSELNSLHSAILQQLMQLYSNTKNIEETSSTDYEKVGNDSLLFDLKDSYQKFYQYLKVFTANDIFIDINTLEDYKEYNNNKYSYLYELLKRFNDFILTELKSFSETALKFSVKKNDLLEQANKQLESLRSTEANDFMSEIAILERDIKDTENKIVANEKANEQNNAELVKVQNLIDYFNEMKYEADVLWKEINIEVSKKAAEAFEPLKETITTVFTDFYGTFEKDSLSIKIEALPVVNQETGEVVAEEIDIKISALNGESIEVNKYFNTFRLELFATLVQVAIAIASRKNNGVNFPIVIDDIFNSSDFESKAHIHDFIKQLFDLFHKYNEEYPLQFILFTHDETLFESLIATPLETDNNLQFARLFSYQEAEEKGNFKELVYKLPKRFYLDVTTIKTTQKDSK